jgi:hypothetical protein
MHHQKRYITVEGTVRVVPNDGTTGGKEPLTFIVTDAGHSFSVEPSFVGRYLAKFQGAQIRAQGELLQGSDLGELLRINGLTMMRRTPLMTESGRPVAEPSTDSSADVDPLDVSRAEDLTS